MYSIKIESVITESHHLELDIPPEVPCGRVDIFLMPSSGGACHPAIADGLAWLSRNPLLKKRAATDIELDILRERSSWD